MQKEQLVIPQRRGRERGPGDVYRQNTEGIRRDAEIWEMEKRGQEKPGGKGIGEPGKSHMVKYYGNGEGGEDTTRI